MVVVLWCGGGGIKDGRGWSIQHSAQLRLHSVAPARVLSGTQTSIDPATSFFIHCLLPEFYLAITHFTIHEAIFQPIDGSINQYCRLPTVRLIQFCQPHAAAPTLEAVGRRADAISLKSSIEYDSIPRIFPLSYGGPRTPLHVIMSAPMPDQSYLDKVCENLPQDHPLRNNVLPLAQH